MNFADLLKPMLKSSIRIEFDVNTETELPIGTSKIGGNPDLPVDFEWFYYQGKSFDGVCENRPLSFLAQINCEEVKEHDNSSILPSKGILYFFYELATMTWGFDCQDRGSARVFYYPGYISELIRTEFPPVLPEEYIIPEIAITFSSVNELPDFEEFTQLHSGIGYNHQGEYDKAKYMLVSESDEDPEEDTINKLLGYANLIQGGMLEECELTTRGIYTGNSNGHSIVTAQQRENLSKWQLLLQLDSIQTENYELLWGDGGRIYFYINTDDLKVQNFADSWLILQCY